ncbi:MAG: hypothetical protein H0T11_03620 [Chthoniobacterales bacterium]|nr:hypothetical protein [Chthoniobacterales bacterium]
MSVYIIIGGICCAWVMLTLLGGERQQRLNRIKLTQQITGAKNNPTDPHKSGR